MKGSMGSKHELGKRYAKAGGQSHMRQTKLDTRMEMVLLTVFYSSTAAEIGRNPASSKHQIQPGCGDEQADAGRDCRARLARPNSQA